MSKFKTYLNNILHNKIECACILFIATSFSIPVAYAMIPSNLQVNSHKNELENNSELYRLAMYGLEEDVSYHIYGKKELANSLSLKEQARLKYINSINEIAQSNQESTYALFGNQNSNYKYLNFNAMLSDADFKKTYYQDGDTTEALKTIYNMQTLASHISSRPNIDEEVAEQIVYKSYIEAYKKSLPPLLVLSLIDIESSYNPEAKSNAGALGLTQVIPRWHEEKIERYNADLFNINDSITVGTDVLEEYLSLSNGNVKQALQRYNGAYNDSSQYYSNKVLRKMKTLSTITQKNNTLFKEVDEKIG